MAEGPDMGAAEVQAWLRGQRLGPAEVQAWLRGNVITHAMSTSCLPQASDHGSREPRIGNGLVCGHTKHTDIWRLHRSIPSIR